MARLSASGARDIALFIGDTGRSACQDTEQDYLRYEAQHGIVPCVYRLNETDGEQAGFQAALALRRDAPQVDGVLILVNTFAAGAVRAFIQSGVSIPEEMRIATRYDGIRARETWSGLKAVNLHLDEVARLAIDQLFVDVRSDTSVTLLEPGRGIGYQRLYPPGAAAKTDALFRSPLLSAGETLANGYSFCRCRRPAATEGAPETEGRG